MSEQRQRRPERTDGSAAPADEVQARPGTHDRAEEIDALLDEIDSVLESNAEEFVRGFVQKGGQ